MTETNPTTRLNAALSGRYRIERQLGESGMATVYLADDHPSRAPRGPRRDARHENATHHHSTGSMRSRIPWPSSSSVNA
jgi:serine/threonine protein kinase